MKKNNLLLPLWAFLIFSFFALVQCTKKNDEPSGPLGQRIYGVTNDNNLVLFGSQDPATIHLTRAITGLQAGETILGIDFQNVDGVLYAMSSGNRIYTIDTTTAVATVVGTGFTAIEGNAFGFDFNPTVERVRVHSNIGRNRRINYLTGAISNTDPDLNFTDGTTGVPASSACAYTNAVRSPTRPTSTVLFAIDATRDIVITVTDANLGTCTTLGALGFDAGSDVTFDISAKTGVAFASWTPTGQSASRLYTINTGGGAGNRATLVGPIGSNLRIVAMAVPVVM